MTAAAVATAHAPWSLGRSAAFVVGTSAAAGLMAGGASHAFSRDKPSQGPGFQDGEKDDVVRQGLTSGAIGLFVGTMTSNIGAADGRAALVKAGSHILGKGLVFAAGGVALSAAWNAVDKEPVVTKPKRRADQPIMPRPTPASDVPIAPAPIAPTPSVPAWVEAIKLHAADRSPAPSVFFPAVAPTLPTPIMKFGPTQVAGVG